MPPKSFGGEIAGQGWRTGCVVAHDHVVEIAAHLTRPGAQPTEVQPDDWMVIVSQTCDIVAAKLSSEPFVEVLHCRPIKKLRDDFKGLRSTRRLDFKPNTATHEDLALSAHAVEDRYSVPREIFRVHKPDAKRQLSDKSAKRVLDWYALRSARPAWPNNFGRRVKGADDLMLEALASLKDDIAEVRIAIAEGDAELDDETSYHVAVFFVVDQLDWDTDAGARTAVFGAFAKFKAALKDCHGIEVNDDLSRVASGEEFSWQETRTSDLWNFANLSNLDD